MGIESQSGPNPTESSIDNDVTMGSPQPALPTVTPQIISAKRGSSQTPLHPLPLVPAAAQPLIARFNAPSLFPDAIPLLNPVILS